MDLSNFKQWTATDNCPSNFAPQAEMSAVSFSNADLTEGTLTVNHLRNASLVLPMGLFNSDGILQDPAGIFQIIDENTCKYTFSGDLELGRYLFVFKFLYL